MIVWVQVTAERGKMGNRPAREEGRLFSFLTREISLPPPLLVSLASRLHIAS